MTDRRRRRRRRRRTLPSYRTCGAAPLPQVKNIIFDRIQPRDRRFSGNKAKYQLNDENTKKSGVTLGPLMYIKAGQGGGSIKVFTLTGTATPPWIFLPVEQNILNLEERWKRHIHRFPQRLGSEVP